ncbi:MAG: hypothetical protein JSV05_04080 [Candidatus Bathyarchaeota archaeon]|nr:MAG: hypothetical protein JSV05_04080 [Candidatus Bathyarchaeota archaeon]
MMDRPHKKNWYSTAGGILTIVAACVCGLLGFLSLGFYMMEGPMMWLLWQYSPFHFYIIHFFVSFLSGIFVLIGSAIGLAGGVAALTRKRFKLAIVGIGFIIASSIVGMRRITLSIFGPFGFILALLLGVPPIVFSILGLILVRVSRKEFS